MGSAKKKRKPRNTFDGEAPGSPGSPSPDKSPPYEHTPRPAAKATSKTAADAAGEDDATKRAVEAAVEAARREASVAQAAAVEEAVRAAEARAASAVALAEAAAAAAISQASGLANGAHTSPGEAGGPLGLGGYGGLEQPGYESLSAYGFHNVSRPPSNLAHARTHRQSRPLSLPMRVWRTRLSHNVGASPHAIHVPTLTGGRLHARRVHHAGPTEARAERGSRGG